MSDASVFACWVAVGMVTGIGHATGLWSHVRHLRRPRINDAARLIPVIGAFMVASMSHGLFPVTIGWGGGLAATCLLLYARKSA